MIRVLVVDDSLATRRWVERLVRGDPEIVIAGEAAGPQDALSATRTLKPDVVVIGAGLLSGEGEALRLIDAARPAAVVVLVGRETSRAQREQLAALRSAGLRIADKPARGEDKARWAHRFRNTIRTASGVSVVRHLSGRAAAAAGRSAFSRASPVDLVVIGASAGGPKVVGELLAALPPLPVPVVVVMHFPAKMFRYLLDWLSSISTMPVAAVRDGASLDALAGTVCVAAPGRHVAVSSERLAILDGLPRNYCKPSVDVLFESVAEAFGDRSLAVLLTGMGRDGAEGMLRIREAGGHTIAQDEATCPIFGMPREAIALGAAVQVLPDHAIAGAITALTGPAVPQRFPTSSLRAEAAMRPITGSPLTR